VAPPVRHLVGQPHDPLDDVAVVLPLRAVPHEAAVRLQEPSVHTRIPWPTHSARTHTPLAEPP
jgi:hypothetical protein